jgi:hypothetical protein
MNRSYFVREAVSVLGAGAGNNSFEGVFAGNATLKKHTIISSKLC